MLGECSAPLQGAGEISGSWGRVSLFSSGKILIISVVGDFLGLEIPHLEIDSFEP